MYVWNIAFHPVQHIGLGKYILENGLNIDLLGIETVDFIGARGITINLYNANGNEIEYVTTLSSASEDGDLLNSMHSGDSV